jgi:hypothetical protein
MKRNILIGYLTLLLFSGAILFTAKFDLLYLLSIIGAFSGVEWAFLPMPLPPLPYPINIPAPPPTTYSSIQGSPIVTVSWIGIANKLSTIPNNGSNFGVDTSNTKTIGIQEAINSFNVTIGGQAQLVCGDYSITTPITFPSITGGNGIQRISVTAIPGTRVLTNVSSGSACVLLNLNGIQGPYIQHIRFLWQSGVTTCMQTSGSASGGLYLNDTEFFDFPNTGLDDTAALLVDPWLERVNMISCGTGTKAYGASHWTWIRPVIGFCTTGINAGPSTNHDLFGPEFTQNSYHFTFTSAGNYNVMVCMTGGVSDLQGGSHPFFNNLGVGTPTWIGFIKGGYMTGTGVGTVTYFDFNANGYAVFEISSLFLNLGGLNGAINLGGNANGNVKMGKIWFNGTLTITTNGIPIVYTASNTNDYIDTIVSNLPIVTAIVVGSSPFTYVNGSLRQVGVIVQGGSVSMIQFLRGGTSTNTGATGGMFLLNNADSLVVTWSGLPNMFLVPY